jgi:hypothetical protein
LVNRLLRRHGYDDVSSFGEPETLLGLDLVNQSVRELLAERDYPWNIRNDGELKVFAQLTGDASADTPGTDNSVVDLSGLGATGVTSFTGGTNAGTVVARILFTNATSFSDTAMIVRSGTLPVAGTIRLQLESEFPGGAVTATSWKVFFSEYLLPNTVSKVISVTHQNEPVRLLEAPPYSRFDELIPRPHDNEGANPDVVMIGGQGVATYNADSNAVASKRYRLMLWPIPTTATLLHYSYKERLAELTATDDLLVVPTEFADDVIDRAEALSNLTQRWNDPALAQMQMANSRITAERKWVNATQDPSRRHGLRPHDSGTRRRDPTRYRDIGSL